MVRRRTTGSCSAPAGDVFVVGEGSNCDLTEARPPAASIRWAARELCWYGEVARRTLRPTRGLDALRRPRLPAPREATVQASVPAQYVQRDLVRGGAPCIFVEPVLDGAAEEAASGIARPAGRVRAAVRRYSWSIHDAGAAGRRPGNGKAWPTAALSRTASDLVFTSATVSRSPGARAAFPRWRLGHRRDCVGERAPATSTYCSCASRPRRHPRAGDPP